MERKLEKRYDFLSFSSFFFIVLQFLDLSFGVLVVCDYGDGLDLLLAGKIVTFA